MNFPCRSAARHFRSTIKKADISPTFSVLFVANERFFGREFLYGDASGDYPDNFVRFLFFQKAALAYIGKNNLIFDIIHCNDWQTALVPLFVKLESRSSLFTRTQDVFSIHNLGYQGIFAGGSFQADRVSPTIFFLRNTSNFTANLNCLKAGIIFSDWSVTVSPTYAREIVLAGEGIRPGWPAQKIFLQVERNFERRRLFPVEPGNRSRSSAFAIPWARWIKKIKNKQKLFAELGIVKDGQSPLLVLISRISEQKGVELLLELLPVLLVEKISFYFSGSRRSAR